MLDLGYGNALVVGMLIVLFFIFAPWAEGPKEGEIKTDEVTVEITSNSFEPGKVTVKKGTTVTWVNRLDRKVWPASNQHPIHTEYPGGNYGLPGSYGGSQACKGRGKPKGNAFDACKPLQKGEKFSFTFNEVGRWSYHDHLRPSLRGTVVVK